MSTFSLLWLYLSNSQVSIYRTIGPLVINREVRQKNHVGIARHIRVKIGSQIKDLRPKMILTIHFACTREVIQKSVNPNSSLVLIRRK